MSTNVTITGRLGGDPELRFTQAGKAVATVSLVSSKPVKQTDGSWEDTETTWYRVTLWDTLAENAVESLTKGDAVIVVGRLYMDTYQDKTGQERQSLKVNAYNIGPDLKRATWRKTGSARGSASATIEPDPWAAHATDNDIPPF